MTVLSRLAALVVAVGLVVGALAIRAGRDDGDGRGGQDVDVGDGTVLACASDLPEVCRAVEEAGVTTARVDTATTAGAATTVLDGPWLVPTAWADVVDDERARAGVAPLVRSDTVASSPVVLVGYRERVTALAAACGLDPAALTVACVGEFAGARWADVNGEQAWGRVGIDHEAPDTTAGLLTTATVAAGLAGPDFGATELRDPLTAAAFRRLEDSADGTAGIGGVVGSLRVTGPSYADVVVALEADVVGVDEPRFGPLAVVAPDPTFAVELVVVADDDREVQAVVDAIDDRARDALGDAGWRVDGSPPDTPLPGAPALAPRPDGSSLVALRVAWDELVG